MAVAATSPVTCVRPPAVTPTAVRESAPVTTKPCDRAEVMLATPKGGKLAVDVDPVATLRREATCGQSSTREYDQRKTRRGRCQGSNIFQRHRGPVQLRQPSRNWPEHRDPLRVELQQ